MRLKYNSVRNQAELITYISQIGFLPLLRTGIDGWSAEDALLPIYNYSPLPEGGWEWPLWEWKSDIILESRCAYGKFLLGKACFISGEWWADFMNYRSSIAPPVADGSIEEMILLTLQEHRRMTTRQLRTACGFTEPKMRGKFDTYIRRLETGCRIVTEDFIYPKDKHGNPYGWGWAVLTTPQQLFGKEACRAHCSPEESLRKMVQHFLKFLPYATEESIVSILSRGA